MNFSIPKPSILDIYSVTVYDAPKEELVIRFLKYKSTGGDITVKEVAGERAEKIMHVLDELPTNGQKDFAARLMAFAYDVGNTVPSSPTTDTLEATEYNVRIISDVAGYPEIQLFKGPISDCKIIKLISGWEARQRLMAIGHLTTEQRIEALKQLALSYDMVQEMTKLKEKENG